jgi:hypothetical protein
MTRSSRTLARSYGHFSEETACSLSSPVLRGYRNLGRIVGEEQVSGRNRMRKAKFGSGTSHSVFLSFS